MTSDQPLRDLIADVIRLAISDASTPQRSRKAEAWQRDREQARRWIAETSDHRGSFVCYCHLIDLDPDVIRARLLRREAA